MKKNKLLMFCALFMVGTFALTACGTNNGNNSKEAPYQDETNYKVNDMYNNGTNNDYNNGYDNGNVGDDLKDAGRNLMDSIKDTGDAIRDGVNNLGNGTTNNNKIIKNLKVFFIALYPLRFSIHTRKRALFSFSNGCSFSLCLIIFYTLPLL